MIATLLTGDSLTILQTIPSSIVRCCVTSPPYWGLRDYGVSGQLGLESTPEEYTAKLVEVFREVRRLLVNDGTLWLNLGDSYAAGGKGGGGSYMAERAEAAWQQRSTLNGWKPAPPGLKSKDLVGIPWRLAFALQADGWYLRSDIIWHKPNPMPESVTDRPTKAHEYLFLLSKSTRYYYDTAAIAEPAAWLDGPHSPDKIASPMRQGFARRAARKFGAVKQKGTMRKDIGNTFIDTGVRNARSVWTIATQPYAGAHFATFPEELARRSILAGSAPGDTVLDPFGGSGTVAQVATGNGRSAIHIDLNPAYIELARQRIGPILTVSEYQSPIPK